MAASSGHLKPCFASGSPEIDQQPTSVLEVEERVVKLVRQRLLNGSETSMSHISLWQLSSEIKIMYSGSDDEIKNPAYRQKTHVRLSFPPMRLFPCAERMRVRAREFMLPNSG